MKRNIREKVKLEYPIKNLSSVVLEKLKDMKSEREKKYSLMQKINSPIKRRRRNVSQRFYQSLKVVKTKSEQHTMRKLKNVDFELKKAKLMEKKARRAEINQRYDEANFEANDIYLDIINKKLSLIEQENK